MTSQSSSQSLSLAYFPFTSMAPSLLEALTPCFHRLVLYGPVGSVLPGGVQRWVDKGSLEICIPFEDVIDKKALVAELQQWRTWGLLNQDADMAYFKAVGGQIAPVDPSTPKLVSEIKAAVHETKTVPKNGNLAVQLFLHLAQDFDERSRELTEHLLRFKLQQQDLQDFFRIDEAEEGEVFTSEEPFTASKEDLGNLMTANRMTAWSHLFQKHHDEFTILFTDSRAAHTWLLDPVSERIEVPELSVSCTDPQADKLSWKGPLHNLFRELITTPWSEQLRQRIEEEGLRLGNRAENGNQSPRQFRQKGASLHWSLVPNESPCTLLKKRCGLETGCDGAGCPKNTIVGLLEHRA